MTFPVGKVFLSQRLIGSRFKSAVQYLIFADGQHGRDGCELLAVLAPVVDHVFLVAPGGHAGGLHGRAHSAAVVGTVEQEALDERRIPRHETTAQAGHVAANEIRPHVGIMSAGRLNFGSKNGANS